MSAAALLWAAPDTLPAPRRFAEDDHASVMTRISFAIAGLLLCVRAFAGEDASTTPEQRKDWQTKLAALTQKIEATPRSVNLFSQRGDVRFFLADFDASVADYSQMTTLDPSQDASHWRRGIALFYAGQYEQAAEQFERYHSFDQIDRENGIWRYLSQRKASGLEKARQGLLKYEKDDREPFPDVYKLFAGTIQPIEILQRIDDAKVSDDEREKRRFYAELYIGLNEAVEDRAESAKAHLAKAVANRWPQEAGYGPNYMWHVGRVHLDLLNAPPTKKPND
jgi:lipoprotein NlpI